MKLVLLTALAVLSAAASAAAAPPHVGSPVDVSVPDPLPHGCGDRTFPGGDFEPHAAVDPHDPSKIAVAWIEGTGVTIAVASTRDGGRTWHRALVPGIRCTGDTSATTTGDPWLSFGPDGVLYLTAGSVHGTRDPAGTERLARVVASRSRDGGRTWSRATVVADENDFNDKMAITADPARPGHAWIVWTRGREGPEFVSGDVRISETHDGGRTWSPSRVILETLPEPDRYPWGATLRVLPDGRLLAVTMVWQPAGISELPLPARGNFDAMAVRSADGGTTWSEPVRIAEVPAAAVTYPDDGSKVRANQGTSLEVGPNGTAYVTWWEHSPTGQARVVLSASRDGGATWSEPRVVGSATDTGFLPALAVQHDGTIGVTYYDIRHDRTGDGVFTTELRFAHSHDGGATWADTRLTHPFDLRSAQTVAGGFFLGDYFGLAATRAGFVSVPALPKPYSHDGPSDVFAIPIAFKRAQPRLRIAVRPRSARVDRRTRFAFRVTAVAVRPDGRRVRRRISRARVRFAGRAARTNRRGRAKIVATLKRAKRYQATVTKRGYVRGRATIRGVPR